MHYTTLSTFEPSVESKAGAGTGSCDGEGGGGAFEVVSEGGALEEVSAGGGAATDGATGVSADEVGGAGFGSGAGGGGAGVGGSLTCTWRWLTGSNTKAMIILRLRSKHAFNKNYSLFILYNVNENTRIVKHRILPAAALLRLQRGVIFYRVKLCAAACWKSSGLRQASIFSGYGSLG
jgi:hypothetical protein